MATSGGQTYADYGEGTSTGVTPRMSRDESFSRLNDTLVETVLSYLTFNEKVALECVCKRFHRLIYNRQTELHLTRWDPEGADSLNAILEAVQVVDYNTGAAADLELKAINKKWLNTIVKKCRSINKVVLDCYADRQDLDIICANCPNLKTLCFETIGLDTNDLDHIGRHYGHNFHEIFFYSSYFSSKYWKNLLIHCKNLRKLSSSNNHDLIVDECDYLPQLEVINDYQIHQDYTGQPDGDLKTLNLFNKCCRKFGTTLRRVSLSSYMMMNSTQLEHFFDSLCELRSLNHLSLFFQTEEETIGTIDQYLIRFSEKCSNLEYFSFSVHSQKLEFDNIFEAFKEFKNLKEFYFYVNSISVCESLNGSVECLRSANSLKRLTISFEKISEDFFDEIAKRLPNLSELTIECETEFSDRIIGQLSGLKKLKKFYLNKYKRCNKSITDASICSIIDNCPHIQTISFASRPNITSKTIEALISCANKYPKRDFSFDCGLSEAEDENELPVIDLVQFVDRIPNNLRIDITEPTANDDQNND